MTDPLLEELREEGLAACRARLDDAERHLTGSGSAPLAALRRDLHSLKGVAQGFGLTPLDEAVHAVEDSLAPLSELKPDHIPIIQRLIGELDAVLIAVDERREPVMDGFRRTLAQASRLLAV